MPEVPKPSMEAVYDHYGLDIIGADRGGWRKAVCPLPEHEDDNPSAAVNEDRWRCHACDQGGDAIDVIQRREGLSWKEARAVATQLLTGEEVPSAGIRRARPGRSGGFVPPWRRL